MLGQSTGSLTPDNNPNDHSFPEDVSAAVVAYNAIGTIEACMQGLTDAHCPHEKVTVYDVSSNDGTLAWLTEHYPLVTVVSLEKNKGPNPARNLAVTDCPTPFVLLLDADVQLLPDTPAKLRQAFHENDQIAVATPVVLYSDRPDTVQYSRTWVHYLAEASAEVDDKPLTQLQGRTERVGLASGCAPLIHTDAARKAGLFEPRYFFGKTDGEFAYRITISGYDIVEPANAQVLHHHHKRGSKYYKHQLCNRWHFMLKDFQLRTLIAIAPLLLFHEPALFLLVLVMGKAGEYFQAVGSLIKLLPTLLEDRRKVSRARHRHDWQVLRGDKLVLPGNIDRGGLIGASAACYRTVLNVYWLIARRVLAVFSRPWPDGDSLVMESALPFQPHDASTEAAKTNAA